MQRWTPQLHVCQCCTDADFMNPQGRRRKRVGGGGAHEMLGHKHRSWLLPTSSIRSAASCEMRAGSTSTWLSETWRIRKDVSVNTASGMTASLFLSRFSRSRWQQPLRASGSMVRALCARSSVLRLALCHSTSGGQAPSSRPVRERSPTLGVIRAISAPSPSPAPTCLPCSTHHS